MQISVLYEIKNEQIEFLPLKNSLMKDTQKNNHSKRTNGFVSICESFWLLNSIIHF